MPDVLDEAQALEEKLRDAAVEAARLGGGEGFTHCVICGAEIPEARRLAVPSARRCVDCQAELEGA